MTKKTQPAKEEVAATAPRKRSPAKSKQTNVVDDTLIASAKKKVGEKQSAVRSAKKRGEPAVAAAAECEKGGSTQETEDQSLDATKLPLKWQLFIEEYLLHQNATRAAINAGYSPLRASNQGHILRHDPRIAPIIEALIAEKIEKVRMTRERIISEFENIVEADANELSQYRRVCCRHCWGGESFAYMETPYELAERKRIYDRKMERCKLVETPLVDQPIWDDTRVEGFNATKEPNPECPECWGEGVGRVFMQDTRLLSRRARALYAGAKIGKDGIEIKTHSKEKSMEVLAKHHKVYDETPAVNLNMVSAADLDAIYEEKMAKSRQKSEAVKGRSERLDEDGQAN